TAVSSDVNARAAPTHAVCSRTCPCPAQALFLGRYQSKKRRYHRHNLHATVLKPGTRTIQVSPKDLRAASGSSSACGTAGSGEEAHARPETAPVHSPSGCERAMRIMRKIGLRRRQSVKTGRGHMLEPARSAAPCEDHRSGRAARR